MNADILGWAAAAILLMTMMRQVWTQWRTRSVAGVSRWLFVGQLAASTAFTAYSYQVDNWVFVVTNGLMVFNALLGQFIYLRNKRLASAASTLVGAGEPAAYSAARP
ncbi:MAG: PQ-loop repeat-containing protein [Rhodocyclaceae bacterium]